ncbi:protein of unknown function [Agreia sp. COWG]|nr:protein of unknown function [Agreia sp. COWG]
MPIGLSAHVTGYTEAPHSSVLCCRRHSIGARPDRKQHLAEQIRRIFGLVHSTPQIAEKVIGLVLDDALDPGALLRSNWSAAHQ